MNRLLLRAVSIVLVLTLNAYPILATCGGGGGGGVGGMSAGVGAGRTYFLPWMILAPGNVMPKGAELTLYWFPTSQEAARESELVQSRTLLGYSSRCLAFAVVTSDNVQVAQQFGVEGKLPAAVLVEADGREVFRFESEGEKLKRKHIEKPIKNEYKARKKLIDAQMKKAKKGRKAGDKEAAIALYRDVWNQRCMFPKKGKSAAKELKKLGIVMADDEAKQQTSMNLSEETNERIIALMQQGLEAEDSGDYKAALDFYDTARRLDPADPVPLRYLGELYRHHTGDWDRAAQTFQQILNMQADPISRAVAQHGLGKMTIHGGEFEKGLAMIEASIKTFPLALAYRNLAVYWNSEKDFGKAYAYARKALILDEKDPYNIVFAATYLAGLGRRDEALRIATEHADLLAGSYNLAAIHALAGNREVALGLLKRHFYQYESNDRVRAKEMWEARQDFVFASLIDDADFVRLTALADQHLGAP